MGGHCRYQPGTYIHPSDVPITLPKPWCAVSLLDALIAACKPPIPLICGLMEFAGGIMALGISGHRCGRRQHALRWPAESPADLVSRAA